MRSLLNTEINRAERGEGGWHEKSKTGSLYKVQSRGPNWDMSSMGVKGAEKRRQRAQFQRLFRLDYGILRTH